MVSLTVNFAPFKSFTSAKSLNFYENNNID